MKTPHLTKTEISLCAEALAMDSAARTVNDTSKSHLRQCAKCTKEVNSIAEAIRQKYNEEIVIGLNSTSKSHKTIFSWLGISASIILIFILGAFIMTSLNHMS